MGKWTLACLALVLCLGLGGCEFGNVEEMYALPKSSEAYVNLQAKINQEKKGGEYIAPLSGDNRQTIQLVDMDGDGVQEAVAFFRDTSAAAPLKLVIFKQDDREDYQVYARIEGVGSEIESVEYVQLGGSEGMDILVSWHVSTGVHSLVGYSFSDGQPVEILRSSYSRYLTADLDDDGLQEVILAQPAGGGSPGLRMEYYDGRDGILELMSTAPLSEGSTDISSWQVGRTENGVPALFVTSFFGKDVLVTDVFCLKEGQGLRNIAMDPATRRSKDVFHYYAGVQPEDINDDGSLEVPVALPVPAYGVSSVDRFWWLAWVDYRADGSRTQAMTTYHSGDGWYLELPESWTGTFSMQRQESSTVGVRTVTFAQGTEEETEDPVPFLEISCLVGSDRNRQASQGERFTLYANDTTIYAAQFLDGGWDCGLDQQSLTERFHITEDRWLTSQ